MSHTTSHATSDLLPGEVLDDAPPILPVGEPVAEFTGVELNRDAGLLSCKYRLVQSMSDGSRKVIGNTGTNVRLEDLEHESLKIDVDDQKVSILDLIKMFNAAANRLRVATRDGIGPFGATVGP